MKKQLLGWLTLAVVFGVVSDPLRAHHSGALYDKDHPVTLTGTVTSFELVNPHARILFVVKDENGVETNWTGGGGSILNMVRVNGWKRNSLKPGDRITVTGSLLKDGQDKKEIRIAKVVMPDGKVLITGAE